jgi:hypothetical protein
VTGTQSQTTANLTVADAKNQVWRGSIWTPSSLSFACMGARDSNDSGTEMSKLKAGSTFTFRVGFDYFRDNTSPAVVTSTSTIDYSFSIIDSAASGSVWIFASLTAVTISVAATIF